MPALRLADFLDEDLVFWDLPRLDKPELLKALAARLAARCPTLDEGELRDRLLAREAQQTTGVGGGLALPHATVPGLEATVLVVGRAGEGLDFDAPDSEPVDLLFLLLSPPESQTLHLRLLARLARIFSGESLLERLRGATGPKEVVRLLREEDARHVY